MRSNTDSVAQAVRRREAWQSVIGATLLRLAMGALMLGLRWYYQMAGFASAVMLIVALANLGSIPPAWILLRQRLKEIEGGEEDAAAQY